ncbi:MAG: hypothetical protein LQ337_001015 [Flavoplaca oasis]|nr:MAG: hypothetical protein LQ337_001015 [Flavoplaca oasis]
MGLRTSALSHAVSAVRRVRFAVRRARQWWREVEEYGQWEMRRDRIEKELRKGQVEPGWSGGNEDGDEAGEEIDDGYVEKTPLQFF